MVYLQLVSEEKLEIPVSLLSELERLHRFWKRPITDHQSSRLALTDDELSEIGRRTVILKIIPDIQRLAVEQLILRKYLSQDELSHQELEGWMMR